jgi:hypothetical protein
MKLRTRVALQLASLFFALGLSAFASDNAYLYLVNGIPGRDVADNLNPGFPVDILIDGDCLVRNLSFGNTAGPYSFSAGTYNVQISESNSLAPCTNAAVLTGQVTLASGASLSAVAALSAGQSTLLQFTDNLTPVAPGNARFVIANSADAPALVAKLKQVDVKNPKTFTVTASPDAQASVTVRAGIYLVQVYEAGNTTVLTSEQIDLSNQSVTFAYAAGVASNDSVSLIDRVVKDVF